jgi:tape measure domain-containing protein
MGNNLYSKIYKGFEEISIGQGLSDVSRERVFKAVRQMLYKGVITSEEFQGQLAESLPLVKSLLIKSLLTSGKIASCLTTKDQSSTVENLIREGSLRSDEVLSSMIVEFNRFCK